MFNYVLEGIFYMMCCILVDFIAEKFKIEGRYYLVHTICNFFITLLTFNDLIFTYVNFLDFINYPMNFRAATITFALHIYHTIWYFKKLRFDDWLHHILTCGLALPLTMFVNCGSLLGHSLFFLTGLPGGIDYFLLFLNRNGYINKMTEKKINNYLNLWIRCPGCISQAVVTAAGYSMINSLDDSLLSTYDLYTGVITGLIVFWNGVYFMNQVVVNYAIESYKKN